ncbi:hypothetical protein MNBD_ALPHA08-1099 [hydrothermal vent metagenome]|uniref:Methyltransferase domain-containing protein n=1 Tax=hydrothermal vent metagenome TaxID=652676 RepID=A0A3B0S5Q1_9ZZZZ
MADKRFLDKAYGIKSDDQALEMYQAWAETYDIEVLDENDYRQPERCALALKKHLPDGDVAILDVGCGTGLSGLGLKAHGYQLVDGCDFSPAMLDKASQTGAYRQLFEANLNQPPLDVPDGAYQAATAVGIFSFGHVDADAMDEILRVVQPGGFVVIGLNQHFYEEGSLVEKIRQLEISDKIRLLSQEHGAHVPGTGLTGWVMVLEKL